MPKLIPNKESFDKAKLLMTKPKKENKINMPVVDPSIEPGIIHQADLLFIPNDNGYKYALVVVDLGSRLCQAEPLKDKTSKEVLKAIRKIYNYSKVLKLPKRLEVDDGSEFKSIFKKYFEHNLIKITMRVSKPNRSRMQCVVERYNGMIAKAIFEILHALEIQTGETQTQWVEDLQIIVSEINKRAKKRVAKALKMNSDPRCEGISCELLYVGDTVRVISDQPRDTTGIKLHGKHRITDIRWEPKEHDIIQVIIRPYQPPLYRVSDIPTVAYTRLQLQLVKKV